ncbi:MAG: hypothetical protein ACXWBO_01270 [Ilumatobacteraceae bacterium]
MGSLLEINDTLQCTTEQGFPVYIFDLERHQKTPITIDDVKDQSFTFFGMPNMRFYQHTPTRVYLAHHTPNDKWLFWGTILIHSQTITGSDRDHIVTSGEYTFQRVYSPEYQEMFTREECPPGLSYFG